MIDISADMFAKSHIHTLIVHKKGNKSELWIKIHDIQDKLGVKNSYDLTIKAIKGIYETKTPTKKQIEKCKIYEKNYSADLTGIYILEELDLLIIMDCRAQAAIEFRTILGFNQSDLIMTKERSAFNNKSIFKRKNFTATFCFKLQK